MRKTIPSFQTAYNPGNKQTSKSERERQMPHSITFMWNLKYDTNELIYETDTDSDTENRFVFAKGKEVGREGSGVWN